MKRAQDTKVSDYVSYKEVWFSNTAMSNDINNEPEDDQLELIRQCAQNVFDPLRIFVGGAVKINSIFRSRALNACIKGASNTSQHSVGLDPKKRSYGAAMDIDDNYGHMTNAEMGHWIRENLDFDQLIYEYPDEKGAPGWIHVSYRPDGKNRKQVLIARSGFPAKERYVLYKDFTHLVAS